MTNLIDDSAKDDWIAPYHSALVELDSHKLGQRIERARTAIEARLEALAADSGHEHQALRDALRNLRVLQQELTPAAQATSHSPVYAHPELAGKYVVAVDRNRRYLEVTDGVCALLGYTREELISKSIDDITAPELRGKVFETFQRYVSNGRMSGEFLLVARDGQRVPIHYESKVFPDGCLVACWEPLPAP